MTDSSHAKLRVAIVHDWLNVVGGAERVLEQMLLEFPEADLYTLIDTLPEDARAMLGGRRPTVSFIGRSRLLRDRHRFALPLMPLAIESFDLTGYDLVLSSSFAVAKGAIVRPDAVHVCYCHSPMRYIWDLEHTYRRDAGLDRGLRGFAASAMISFLRMWDVSSANRADTLVANSTFTASRIRRYWGRDSLLLPPPVDISRFSPSGERSDYYVTVSRLVPYKRHDLMVKAFAQLPDRRLVIVGDGPNRSALQRIAPANVEFTGALPDAEVARVVGKARAFVFAAHEDFGIVPVEAQASGVPVIAYGVGGSRDTVVPWPNEGATGVFFDTQTEEALVDAVHRFESVEHAFDRDTLRANAERFSNAHFRRRLRQIVEDARRVGRPPAP